MKLYLVVSQLLAMLEEDEEFSHWREVDDAVDECYRGAVRNLRGLRNSLEALEEPI